MSFLKSRSRINLVNQDASETYFKVKSTTALSKVMRAYVAKIEEQAKRCALDAEMQDHATAQRVEKWLNEHDSYGNNAAVLIERVQHVMKVSTQYAKVLVGEYLDFLELKAAVRDWQPHGGFGCTLSPPPLIDE
eukprot:5557627-Prymnesium_polylepis.1